MSFLLTYVDISPSTWSGRYDEAKYQPFDKWISSDAQSLFYVFNNIPSPSPNVDAVSTSRDRTLMRELLDHRSSVAGLRANLYPYQRRSAALMLQRENEVRLHLDPRLERRSAPDGSEYYYDARTFSMFRQPRLYDSCKGGILTETMGLGKTIICIALILATKSHLPKTPAQYEKVTTRPLCQPS